MEMVNYLRYKDIHKSQSAGWWWGLPFPGNTPLLLAYTKGNGDLCRALVSQKFHWQHERILSAAGEKRRHIGYYEQGQWKHLQLSSCDKTTPFQVISQNLIHNTNIHTSIEFPPFFRSKFRKILRMLKLRFMQVCRDYALFEGHFWPNLMHDNFCMTKPVPTKKSKSDFRKIFRFAEKFQICGNFWKMFRFSENMTFREHPQRVTLENCYLRLDTWDTFMTIENNNINNYIVTLE